MKHSEYVKLLEEKQRMITEVQKYNELKVLYPEVRKKIMDIIENQTKIYFYLASKESEDVLKPLTNME